MQSSNKKAVINSIAGSKRLSTQELLQQIYQKMDEGFTEFEIQASGQHNIGGPLWTKDGSPLKFTVKNPGQRIGSMGMHGTEIIIEGPAPADVGWLNAGAEIILKGDGGDTTAHCAATGSIYVGGRVGTRSGALMKYDPKFPSPEFWVLKNTGSFSFEFMGGGTAVVCGYECETLSSVLGSRSCVGMVGGTIYVRGPVKDVSSDVWVMDLDSKDKDFLLSGLYKFLDKIEKPELFSVLTDFSQWRKIVSKTLEERKSKYFPSISDFRKNNWVEGGIFGDLIVDDYQVSEFVETKDRRLRIPEWKNATYCAPCEYNCPINIPTQRRLALLREGKIQEALRMVLDFSPFPASVCGQVCPNLCMEDCNRQFIDLPVKVAELGLATSELSVPVPKFEREEKIAIIGAGASGLGAAWHLRRLGYKVDVFEKDNIIGGKLKQVIPSDRLKGDILNAELKRFEEIGVKFITETTVDSSLFTQLIKDYNSVVVAVGAHNPVVLPIEGSEKLVKGLDFLKLVNKGKMPVVGSKVVVIGAGNAAMDVVIGAYKMGAQKVTAIDIQKPAAFDKEIEHAKSLGAEILWPCFTQKITDSGVQLKDGLFIEADTVIIAVGDRPDFAFLGSEYLNEKGQVLINEYFQSQANEKVFVVGDAIKQGLFTHAIGDGRKVAINIDRIFHKLKPDDFKKAPMIPRDKVKTEFYQGINLNKVDSMDVECEKDRCMSCANCRDCQFCENICPEQAISRIEKEDGMFEYVSDSKKCIGCGICAGVCPCGVWTMQNNFEKFQEL